LERPGAIGLINPNGPKRRKRVSARHQVNGWIELRKALALSLKAGSAEETGFLRSVRIL